MLRLSLFAAALVISTGAQAQDLATGQGRLEIAGQAPAACVLNAPVVSSAQNAAFASTGAASGEIRIVQLGDPQTAQPRAAAINLALPVICNAPHRLTVTSTNGGLLRDGGNARNRQSPTGFGELLGFQINASWAGQTSSVLTTTSNTLVINSTGGGAGDMDLNIVVTPGGGPLVAGRYADTVTVQFQAAI